MTTKIKQSIIGGLFGTVVMTAVTMVAPLMGMPKMSPPAILSMMMGVPLMVGWVMHFMVGIIFAMSYAFIIHKMLGKISNNNLKGAIFGIIVFVFAQIMLGIMGSFMTMPPMEGTMALMMVGSIIGHIIYGITVSMFVRD